MGILGTHPAVFVRDLMRQRRMRSLIYEPTEHADFEFLPPNPLTIKDVLDDVNEVRNCIAHGDRIPDRYFVPGGGRQTLNGVVNFLAVLDDSLSFIIRDLLKILRDDHVENFKSRHNTRCSGRKWGSRLKRG
jgi:hypothetical protein